MTASELIQQLQQLPPDTKVCVLDKEGEPSEVESIEKCTLVRAMHIDEEAVLLVNY